MQLESFDGILVPGGFGKRGIEGMLQRHSLRPREKGAVLRHLPGMQTACIEYARKRLRPRRGGFQRVQPSTPHRVIYKLRELRGIEELGGTIAPGRLDL